MLKKLGIYATLATLLCGSVACNESTTNDFSFEYSSTLVKSFSLRSNSDILKNLDSVFFSIDLVSANIFNADSLPVGTKVSRMLVDLTTDNCSTVELRFPRAGKSDSVVNYLTNPDDSIDFSLGPVTLHLVSYDKTASRDYYIRVNVHREVADSLVWDVANPLSLPTSIASPTQQRTVAYGNEFYTFTTSGTADACVNKASSPAHAGVNTSFTFPFTPVISSLTATSTAIYILANDGTLYSSADGTSWNSCGVNWTSITAAYGSTLLGTATVGDKLMHVSYPAGTTQVVAANFPVTGNSQAFTYTSDWNITPMIITVGGRNQAGDITPTAWAYDGTTWACIANDVPMQSTDLTLIPYYCSQTDSTSWRATTRSVILAVGGRIDNATMQDSVYMSYDLGFHWAKAPAVMQLPATFPHLAGSQAFIVNAENTSRAIKPITEWDTPYIYMYGGYALDGKLSNRIYRGVINRLQYKPLQ